MSSTPSPSGSTARNDAGPEEVEGVLQRPTFGSLFAGIGGFDLGLERAGWSCKWQVEKDEFCRGVLRHRFPNVERFDDVTTVGAGQLIRVDLICGGFPCQDLSVAGSRAGLAGERSGLFYEFMRVVDQLSPRWVLIENVDGLRSSNGGRDMGTVVGTLGDIGYWWTYRVLDTQFFGPPQRRKRVFIVGHLGAPCPPEVLLEPAGLPWDPRPSRPTRESAAEGSEGGAGGGHVAVNADRGLAPHGSMEGEYELSPTLSEAEWRRQSFVFKASHYTRGKDGAPSTVSPPLSADADKGDQDLIVFDTTQITHPENRSNPLPGDPCHSLPRDGHPPVLLAYNIYPVSGQGADLEASPTEVGNLGGKLDAKTERGTRVIDAEGLPRRFTPRECERLHGFPDDWTRYSTPIRSGSTPFRSGPPIENADTPRYRTLGNAVSVPVAHWIGDRIRRAHESP